MLTQFFSIGLLMLLSAMLPGPDFAIVTKNTVLNSRRAGLFTTFGITTAIAVHMSYCLLGLALIISQSLLLFTAIKYIGAIYLIYLGITALLAKPNNPKAFAANNNLQKSTMNAMTAFRQGFLCNLLNPKATLFFLALFTVIIKPGTSGFWELIYAIEMLVIATLWFSLLTMLLSHPRLLRLFKKAEPAIEKFLGVFLIGFGIALTLVQK